eukprot:TRINITY_DN12582_c0_g1_i1.p1 TRINITY_DN12582_c0_g1~~TRINITY_DN12582_c0_g1_i1.p1  ORF type:complete len:293 (+),score=44.76 TRINITY_DN12582_c0_g1_i1:89-967(+)
MRSAAEMKMVVACTFIMVTLVLIFYSITIVPVGHVAVMDLFGSVYEKPLQPGMQLVNPFATVRPMNIKTQLMGLQAQVPSKEGLVVDFEMGVLYHLLPEMAVEVYKTIGPSYADVVLAPQLRSAVRHLTSGFEAKALYTAESREAMSIQLVKELRGLLGPRGIQIEDALLKEVRLPLTLQQAIQAKLAAEQESQRMEFVLMKERSEAERKAIEAKGIADFQRIVSEGVSPALLRWKGIEATEALAKSDNAKIVIIGNSNDGLPLILGGVSDLPPEDRHTNDLRKAANDFKSS